MFSVIQILVIAACCVLAGTFSMHYLQLRRYQIADLSKAQRKNADRLLLPDVLIAAGAAVTHWYLPFLLSMVIQKEAKRELAGNWIALALFAIAALLLFLYRRRAPMKKPFGVTRRICRLMLLCFLLNLAGIVLLKLVFLSPYLIFAAADMMVLLAARIMHPLENRINAGFYNSARAKLAAADDLIRIGVTGSYGKTDVKLMLKTILSEKYKVLSTPPSFSTAMGISRVVNEQLEKKHQVFIAEMGAQNKGEIREMAKLVAPQYGVLTCVGPAHLDSFGSIEAAAQTKYELIESLPKDGMAFFGSDASYGDRLYHMCKAEKYRAGMGSELDYFMRAEHVETGVHGTRLKLVCADGSSAWLQIRLLGSFHVRNLALSAALARKLGLSMEEIARGAEKIKPQKHLLQLVPGDVIVIDNSANTLPEGAEEALRVLREFPGRRILVTGGLTELEEKYDEKNFAYGTRIGSCADYVILIDPEATRSVMNGLMSAKFPKSAVRMVRESADAAAIVKEIAAKGDTVLYEGVYPEE